MASNLGAFKKLKDGDYQVLPYKAHKTWKFDEASINERDINVFKGELNNKTDLAATTGSTNEMKATKDTVYREIRHLYYGGSPNTGSGMNPTIIGNGQRAGDPYHTFGSNSDKCFTNLDGKNLTWILTPQLVYGEKIKPGSVKLTDKSTGNLITIYDDGHGNLYDNADSSSLSSLDQSTTEFMYDNDNLVGYWSLNGNLVDRGFRSFNDGTHSGTAVYTTSSAYFKALTFDSASAESVYLPSSTSTGSWEDGFGNKGGYDFNYDDNFSLSVWVKATTEPDTIYGAGNTVNIMSRALLYGIDYSITDNYVRAGVRGSNGSMDFIQSSVNTDISSSWTHLAFTYAATSSIDSQAGGMRLYVNGTLVDSGSTLNHKQFATASSGVKPLQLGGKDVVAGSGRHFSGSLDEARIYNKSLTAKEVKALYDFPDGTPYIGNAFYEHGNLVITGQGKYNTIASGTTDTDGFDLEFKGTVTNYEHVIYCTVGENEYNFTMNDTLRKRDEDGVMDENDSVIDMATGSEFQPYITTIGLYDDYRRLIAVAKLGKPFRNDTKLTKTFTIVLDA